MQLIEDLIPAAELVTFARAAQDELADDYELLEFLPTSNEQTDRWEAVRSSGVTPETARFRAPDTPNQTLSRPQVVRASGELPFVGAQTLISEKEAQKLAALAAAGGNPLVDLIYDEAPTVIKSLEQRAELARGQVLSYGGVWINENGVQAVADMGANQATHPGQFPVAATAWDDPAAKIWTDITTWAEAYVETAGEPAATMAVRPQVFGLILRNSEVMAAAGSTAVLSLDALNALTDAHGLPRLRRLSKRVNVDGVMVAPTPNEKVLLLPGDPGGRTVWGITAHAFDWLAAGALPVEQAGGIIVAPYRQDDPPRKYTVGSGVMLPVIERPETLFAAEVLGV